MEFAAVADQRKWRRLAADGRGRVNDVQHWCMPYVVKRSARNVHKVLARTSKRSLHHQSVRMARATV
jgi:hypothetical protein